MWLRHALVGMVAGVQAGSSTSVFLGDAGLSVECKILRKASFPDGEHFVELIRTTPEH